MLRSLTILAAVDAPTREVFGNVPPAAKALFYALTLAAVTVFAVGVYRRARLWRLGRPSGEKISPGAACRRLVANVLLQRRVLDRGLAGTAHVLLFGGFVVLLIGTTLVAVEHVLAASLGRHGLEPVFHKGVYYAVFEIATDAFGLALLAGCILFVVRRARRPASLGHNGLDWIVLAALFLIVVTGYLLEGLRILHEQPSVPEYSFAGMLTASLLKAVALPQTAVPALHLGAWWLHAILALGLIAAIPYTRLMHVLAGVLNLVGAEREPLGTMRLVSLEEVEEAGAVGVGEIRQLRRRQIVELDACVSCGRCEEACPAHEAGKPLSPKNLVQDVRKNLNAVGRQLLRAASRDKPEPDAGDDPSPALHGETIAAETLWSCTVCTACTDVCPLGVRPADTITDMRRHLIAEGQFRGTPAAALQKMQRSGNPWGLPAEDRFHWADGLNVPTAAESPDFEILYWVGCAAAYDRRLQKVARSVVRLLQKAGVRFAVLGCEERCTGETARRMGDEFLFQELAETNIETLNRYGVKRIVTHCPHCLNTFRRDYPQLGGRYEAVHHSRYLMELIQAGRLRIEPASLPEIGPVTYHDPCYLARVAGITEPPRALLQPCGPGNGRQLIEMPRNRRHTSCCGAGGGRMWFDDTPAERIGAGRAREALATGAETVAVSCPFCLLMLSDLVAAENGSADVRDVAELLANAGGKQYDA